MRIILSLGFILGAGPALAHVGHIGEVAGHAHWIALGAIGLAAAVGALAAKGRRDDEVSDEAEEDTDGEEQSA